jgi:hypothetical protein
MAWTTPGTAVAGEVLTAAFWNANVRDNSESLRAIMANTKSTKLTTATTVTLTTAGTFYDVTGVSVSITPTESTSKIMVWADVDCSLGAANLLALRLVRDSTAIGIATSASNRIAASTVRQVLSADVTYGHQSLVTTFLDSPATTSAVTYKIQAASNDNSQTLYVNRSFNDGDNVVSGPRSTSTITVMEIAV